MLCLCDALMSDEEDRHPPPRPDRFVWERNTPMEARLEDGQAHHLESMRTHGVGSLLDAHSHWFPENVEQKIWRYFDRHYWKVSYRFSMDDRLGWMRRNGVERFTVLNYAHRPGMSAWLNDWTMEFASRVPEAIPCGTFFPEPTAGADVRRCIEEYGFRGFKLHLRVGEMDPTDPLLQGAFEQITAAGLPVIIHAGNAPDSGPFTSPDYIEALVKAHPGLIVVIAHMGANEFDAYHKMALEYENLHLDTTMVFVGFLGLHRYPAGLLEQLETISHKVLFGSDFPTIPYRFGHAVEGILKLPLSIEAKRRILGENTARLFGVASPKEAAD